jgi:hypothetical protein
MCIAMLAHFIVGIVYAAGKLQSRIPLMVTGGLPCIFAAIALILWNRFANSTCQLSLCDAFNTMVPGADVSCGAGAGFYITIVAAVMQLLSIFPIVFVARITPQQPADQQGAVPVLSVQVPAHMAQPGFTPHQEVRSNPFNK